MPAASTASVLHEIPIDLGDRSYPIIIGTGLLADPSTWTRVAAGSRRP